MSYFLQVYEIPLVQELPRMSYFLPVYELLQMFYFLQFPPFSLTPKKILRTLKKESLSIYND